MRVGELRVGKMSPNPKGWEAEGEGPRQTRYSNCYSERQATLQWKVPVSAEGWQTRPLQWMRDRPATENSKERQRRLQQTSTNQCARLAVETRTKERETTLQQMSTNQHERLAVESPKERELRLECYSTRCREQQPMQPQLPLFQQYVFHSKPRCHANMASYIGHQYAQLVQKDFFHSKPNGCLCCGSDKHTPKLYSSANNVIPGSIPSPGYTPKWRRRSAGVSGPYIVVTYTTLLKHLWFIHKTTTNLESCNLMCILYLVLF